jgi:purine-binding chemotaxis protein CheW
MANASGPRSRAPGRKASSISQDLASLATRLARDIAAAEAEPPESQPRAIVFRVGPVDLALPLTAVREVVLTPSRLSKVPRAPEALLGIMNLRGRVVAVVDLVHALPVEIAARHLGKRAIGTPGEDLAGGRILIMERGGQEIGLLVRSVAGISTLSSLAPGGPVLLDPEQVGAAIDALVM